MSEPTPRVLYRAEVAPEDLVDILGAKPPGLISVEARGRLPLPGTLLCIDLAPEANWAHPCLWVWISGDAAWVIRHNWPPKVQMREVSRG